MRITQEADYAIRIVCTLAEAERDLLCGKRSESRLGASEISEKTIVPQRFTLTILRKLVMREIVKSFKGKSGGYTLARSADEISLKDVIEVIDGPVAISKCLDLNHECSRQGFNKSACRIHNIFLKINTQVADKLQRISIGDAVNRALSVESILELLD